MFTETFLDLHTTKFLLFLVWILLNIILPSILQEIRQKHHYFKVTAIDCVLDNHNGLRKPFYIGKILFFLPFIIVGLIWAIIRKYLTFIIYKG